MNLPSASYPRVLVFVSLSGNLGSSCGKKCRIHVSCVVFFTFKSFVRTVFDIKRFMSSHPSSQQELQTLDDVRTERVAIAVSVGLSWPPLKRQRSAGRPSFQQRGSLLCSSTSYNFTSSQTVHISPARLGGVQVSLS